jgi:hypothetical protein
MILGAKPCSNMERINVDEVSSSFFEPIVVEDVTKPKEDAPTVEDRPRKKIKKHGISMNEDRTCPIDGCDYMCKSGKKSTFAMHVTMKHQAIIGISIDTYGCSICRRTFASSGLLNQHHDRAHNPWKYRCKTCGYITSNKSSLLIHHVSTHLHMKDSDCVDENGCCVNCAKKLPRTGHKNHFARCTGLHHELFDD